jgi:hypothetical protein
MLERARRGWECVEAECDEVRACCVCHGCHQHCIAVPNDQRAHRNNVSKVLDWLSGHRSRLWN